MKSYLYFFCCIILLTNTPSLLAQCEPELVIDASTSPSCSGIDEVTQLNDSTILFTGWSEAYGEELYKMTNTANSEVLVRDIVSGPFSSSPYQLIKSGDYVYFFITNDQGEHVLAKSDGTLVGTTPVKVLGQYDYVKDIIKVDGVLFFILNTHDNKDILWKSEGTGLSTDSLLQLDEINSLKRFNNMLLFRGKTSAEGGELWKHDIPTGVSSMIKDIRSGTISSLVSRFSGDVFNGKFYFGADNGVDGFELWSTDGTTAGTNLFKDIKLGLGASDVNSITSFAARFYFSADDGVNGYELWESDGTSVNTFMTYDINPLSASSSPSNFNRIGGKLIFNATDAATGRELKIYTPGTGILETKDILTGPSSSFPNVFTVTNNQLIFSADDGVHGSEYWRTDGTLGGTILLKDINPTGSQNNHVITNSTMGSWLIGNDDESCQLWLTDGTSLGTVKMTDLEITNSSSSKIDIAYHEHNQYFIINGDQLTLTRYDPASQQAFPIINNTAVTVFYSAFSTDQGLIFRAISPLGTEIVVIRNDSVKVVKEAGGIDPLNSASLDSAIPYLGGAIFEATTSSHGYEPWFSDGTESGTFMISDINIGANSSGINTSNFILLNSEYYFKAKNADTGVELWKISGTTATASLVTDLMPGISDGIISNLFISDNEIYFKGQNTTVSNALFKTNGTAAGAVLVFDFEALGQNLDEIIIASEEYIYLSVYDDQFDNYEIWRTDTHTGHTAAVTSFASELFSIDDGTNSDKTTFISGKHPLISDYKMLFMFDNSNGLLSTYVFRDVYIDDMYDDPLSVDSILYFKAWTDDYGLELWRSDGTVAGTYMIKDIALGTLHAYPSHMTAHDDLIYFTATDPAHGDEFWRTDGTAANTILIQDFKTGPSSGTVSPDLKVLGADLFIEANTFKTGTELFRIPKSCCLSEMNVNFNPLPNGIYEASNLLTTNGLLPAGGTVLFKTGQEAILSNGFEVENGLLNFEIQIENCQN